MSDPAASPDTLRPGLLVLHGNRLERLAEVVLDYLARHPLGALEEEVVLVQSNGMAEWFKMQQAMHHGICAATRVELPARFLWRAWRTVFGREAVPAVSPLDKLPLTWRLMRELPTLAARPAFAPVAGFLGAGSAPPDLRAYQLAQRLADLFDQYQVYRSDWLQDWEAGHDRLRRRVHGDDAVALAPEQAWQPPLWRHVVGLLPDGERDAARAALHRRFVALLGAAQRRPEGLPRRLVLFGAPHLPTQTLEAIVALSAHVQVLMAVPNPCRFHWADLIDGRELLRSARRRHGLRDGRDLAAVPLQDLHAFGPPLLAAWGRQSRDFVRQLDAFDDTPQLQQRFALPRIDLFDEDEPARTQLQRLQASIRDLVPPDELRRSLQAEGAAPPEAADRSIVFHVAHGAQREVEVLHDQLLHLLAHPPGGTPLAPRDIVVMVPDIEGFAPAIRSVFGQYGRGHARHIPWGISDQRERGHQPLLVALEALLQAPQRRFAFSELRDLLDVPAVARRFGIAADDLPLLARWIEGAGIRWGLHAAQREDLGLAACGEANTWRFGLRRMLLGYATGDRPADGVADTDIEPYGEVGGLSAALAGQLAELLAVLERWWADAHGARAPEAWGARLRTLLAECFEAADDTDRALLASLDDALADWLLACEAAGFDAPLGLAVVREAWLGGVDAGAAARRFRAGGVTFCTLLPLRAVPFEVVCLLGMNDGDYPRRAPRSDFDLMGLPGLARPGDRSRRDDDRQLMLDALLSARRVLYVSWSGRSARDNQPQPPSVLVGQLRDHLAAVWGEPALRARTTEHPLQPFSRRYFEHAPPDDGRGLFTYAAEWRAAHDAPAAAPSDPPSPDHEPVAAAMPLTVDRLARFLRNPVQAFFRERLQVVFDEAAAPAPDDEAFDATGLTRWQLLDDALRTLQAVPGVPAATGVARAVERLRRSGRLPLGGPGVETARALRATLEPMAAYWQACCAQWPHPLPKRPLRLAAAAPGGSPFDDWLLALRRGDDGVALWIGLVASRLTTGDKRSVPRPDKLLAAWLRTLASAACGEPAQGLLIGADVAVTLRPPPVEAARVQLQALMAACDDGLRGERPPPTALLTGLAMLRDARPQAVYDGSEDRPGEGAEACLARLFPDHATLAAQADHEAASRRLYAAFDDALATQLTIAPLPEAAPLEDEDDADG